MTEPGVSAWRFSPRTVWTQRLQTPLRRFVRTETGSAVVLLAATIAALAWANIDPAGYAGTWDTTLVIRSGTWGLADSWQGWVNSGLMAFFFLVVGLEARREFDMGELRERRRLALPVVVAVGGMVVPVAIYLAVNSGRPSASGLGRGHVHRHGVRAWRAGPGRPGVPDRVRTYMLTFALVDDVAGIVIIARRLQRPYRPGRAGRRLALSAWWPWRAGGVSGTAPPTCCWAWRRGSRSSSLASIRWWSAW